MQRRLEPGEYIQWCVYKDPTLFKLGVESAVPGIGIIEHQINPNTQIGPAFRVDPIIYYELGTNYEGSVEGQFISDHTFRIDCRDKKYDIAERIRAATVACLQRGGRLSREGSRFDAFDVSLQIHRRIQEISIEP